MASRARVPARQLSDWPLHRVNRLLQHYPGCTVGQVIGRLKCVTCGRGPIAVVLAEDRPGRRVPLTGPECGY